MSAVEARGLFRRFGERAVLSGVDLRVEAGQFVALLGSSGSGKTTLLRCLAGLDRPCAGTVRAEGRVGLVFQDLGLWPHLTAQRQLALVLRSTGSSRSPAELLERLRIGHRAEAYPSELSGGEAQRLALARTLAADPQVLLLDEPLAGLDRPLRDELFGEVQQVQRELGAATIYVTHDWAEALAADRVAALDGGRLVQQGAPDELYRRPASEAVARLTGPVGLWPDGDVLLALRPEDVALDEAGPLEAVVESARFEAGGWRLGLRVEGRLLWARGATVRAAGQRVRLRLNAGAWRLPEG